MKSIITFFTPTKLKLVLLLMFTAIGFSALFLNGESNPLVRYSPVSSKSLLPTGGIYCRKDNYLLGFSPGAAYSLYVPFFGAMFALSCNVFLSFLVNIVWYYFLSCLSALLIKKFPVR